jgi:hypothetical protein
MGVSQRNYTEMCEYFLIPCEQDIDAWADGSVIKIKAFLGVCAIRFSIYQFDSDRSLRKINFMSLTRKHCTI